MIEYETAAKEKFAYIVPGSGKSFIELFGNQNVTNHFNNELRIDPITRPSPKEMWQGLEIYDRPDDNSHVLYRSLHQEVAKIFDQVIQKRPKSRCFNIIEVGCGFGLGGLECLKIANKSFPDKTKLFGFDFAAENIEKAKKDCPREFTRQVKFIEGNIYDLTHILDGREYNNFKFPGEQKPLTIALSIGAITDEVVGGDSIEIKLLQEMWRQNIDVIIATGKRRPLFHPIPQTAGYKLDLYKIETSPALVEYYQFEWLSLQELVETAKKSIDSLGTLDLVKSPDPLKILSMLAADENFTTKVTTINLALSYLPKENISPLLQVLKENYANLRCIIIDNYYNPEATKLIEQSIAGKYYSLMILSHRASRFLQLFPQDYYQFFNNESIVNYRLAEKIFYPKTFKLGYALQNLFNTIFYDKSGIRIFPSYQILSYMTQLKSESYYLKISLCNANYSNLSEIINKLKKTIRLPIVTPHFTELCQIEQTLTIESTYTISLQELSELIQTALRPLESHDTVIQQVEKINDSIKKKQINELIRPEKFSNYETLAKHLIMANNIVLKYFVTGEIDSKLLLTHMNQAKEESKNFELTSSIAHAFDDVYSLIPKTVIAEKDTSSDYNNISKMEM